VVTQPRSDRSRRSDNEFAHVCHTLNDDYRKLSRYRFHVKKWTTTQVLGTIDHKQRGVSREIVHWLVVAI
jgi:hypothetical protein